VLSVINMSKLIPITTPLRKFKGHKESVTAVAVLPDKRRMITGSRDKTLCLWDLKTGVMLKKMEGHGGGVWGLAVSRDGRLIASGDAGGEAIVWHGKTGESPIKFHSIFITSQSLDFPPDGTELATGSFDKMMKLQNTKTWQQQGNPIEHGSEVSCIRYSPSGQLLAIATHLDIQIYNTGTRERVAFFKAHTGINHSLAWTPDGTHLLTGGDKDDPTIREWDTLTWQQVGDPWTGHTSYVNAIAIDPAGTLVASASYDKHVRLWQLIDRRTIVIFKHSSLTACVSFSMDGKYILSGGGDKIISEWAVPNSKALFCP
jgi:WD40 repeat protein